MENIALEAASRKADEGRSGKEAGRRSSRRICSNVISFHRRDPCLFTYSLISTACRCGGGTLALQIIALIYTCYQFCQTRSRFIIPQWIVEPSVPLVSLRISVFIVLRQSESSSPQIVDTDTKCLYAVCVTDQQRYSSTNSLIVRYSFLSFICFFTLSLNWIWQKPGEL